MGGDCYLQVWNHCQLKQDNCHWIWKRIHLWQALTQYTNVLTHYKDLPHYKDSPSITVEQAN